MTIVHDRAPWGAPRYVAEGVSMFRALAVAFAGLFGFSIYTHRHEVADIVQSVQQRVGGGTSIGACHPH